MTSKNDLSLDRVYQAAFALKDVARMTDLIYSPHFSGKNQVYFKTENLQVTGSFKLRGAYYKISTLSEKEKEACFLQDMKEMLDDDELEVISMIYGFCTGDDGISAAQLERESGYNKQEIKEIRSRAEEKLRCGWSRKNKQDDERKMRAVHLDHAAGIVPDSSTLTDNLASYIPGGDDEFDIFQSIVDYDQKMLGESDQ